MRKHNSSAFLRRLQSSVTKPRASSKTESRRCPYLDNDVSILHDPGDREACDSHVDHQKPRDWPIPRHQGLKGETGLLDGGREAPVQGVEEDTASAGQPKEVAQPDIQDRAGSLPAGGAATARKSGPKGR